MKCVVGPNSRSHDRRVLDTCSGATRGALKVEPVALDIVAGFGFVLLLGAFTLNAAGRLDRSTIAYDGMNAVGAAILTWYAIARAAPVFVLLEVTWASIALVSLLAKLSKSRRRRKEVRRRTKGDAA